MKITNKTGIGIRIETDNSAVAVPAGETVDVIPSSGKIAVYSDKQTSTRVKEEIVKAFHSFHANIVTSCTANISNLPESSEIVITRKHGQFQTSTEYEYFLLKCSGIPLQGVAYEVCDGDKVLNDRQKFYTDYKAEKNVNGIFGFLNKADDFFSDVGILLLIGLFSLPVTMRITYSLIFTGVLFALYLVCLLPFSGIKRNLGRSRSKLLQTVFKKASEPDDLKYFINHINKYCK